MSVATDKSFTTSNHNGDAAYDIHNLKKGEPSHVKWNPFSQEGSVNHKTLACLLSKEKLFLFNPETQEHRFIEFVKAGMSKPYCFEWLSNDKVLVGFGNGTVSVIDVTPEKIGTEHANFTAFN